MKTDVEKLSDQVRILTNWIVFFISFNVTYTMLSSFLK